eukprot:ANDGO_07048.mRNA.1 Isoprenyl transferase
MMDLVLLSWNFGITASSILTVMSTLVLVTLGIFYSKLSIHTVRYVLLYGWKQPFLALEERYRDFSRDRSRFKVPSHIAFIMDGNRRYAKSLRFVNVTSGHEYGAEKVHDVLRWCSEFKEIQEVTLWALSSDNLQRAEDEVQKLWALCKTHLDELADSDEVRKNQVRVRIIGERSRIPADVMKHVEHVERVTMEYNTHKVLNIAIAYGGREEIVSAIKLACEKKPVVQLTMDDISRHCYAFSEPDLIVRTGGDERLSGFLLWQSRYAELVFQRVLWPGFSRVHLLRALCEFDSRNRRFGK